MKLIPTPKLLVQNEEIIAQRTVAIDNTITDERLVKAINKLPVSTDGLPLSFHIGDGIAEDYTLDIRNAGIEISAAGIAGAFYAVQTLRQIFANEIIYACHIEDAPDFGFRGYYHDVTRGKVPTLETLKELVDYMAYTKLNSLQLYVEHSFAFREYANSLDRTGYLTADEIRQLDDYCYENFIELIPSLSCFGHLYVLLEQPQYKHLQEAVDFEQTHIYWYERMAHHTIDPTNPESFILIKSLIDQFVPLFRSDKFNICCDETFDLKNGKHKDLNTGEIYISFVQKLINYVEGYGKKVMMWGDVLHLHPEQVRNISPDVVLLNWYYDSDREVAEKQVKLFEDHNKTQIICPTTWAWNHLSESLCSSVPNITYMTKLAKDYSALGVLNTSWGDYGDPCCFGVPLFGLIYGAARSWNVKTTVETVASCADSLIYENDGTYDILYKLSEIENIIHYGDLAWMYNNLYYPGKLHYTKRTEVELLRSRENAIEIHTELSSQKWKKDYFREKLLLAVEGVVMMAEQMILLRGYSTKRVVDTESWLAKYRQLWLSKHKEGELSEIEKMFRLLEEAISMGKCV